MQKPTRTITLILMTLMLTFTTMTLAEDNEPSGAVTIKETQVGVILNGDWGHGTLTFGDEQRLFHMAGLKLGGMGITFSDVSGDVYNLSNPADFEGTYFKVEAGLTPGIGGSGTWVKNSKGVSIRLVAKSKGLALSIGVGGIRISY